MEGKKYRCKGCGRIQEDEPIYFCSCGHPASYSEPVGGVNQMETKTKEVEFKIHNSLSYADAVKAVLLTHLQGREANEKEICHLNVEAYCNCREQGYCFRFSDDLGKITKTFLVSENRNSDDIVVYHSNKWEPKINDEMWKNRKFFKYNEFDKAAEYILGKIGWGN